MSQHHKNIILRQALPGDAAALAALHVAVWRTTYRALAPQEAYQTLGVGKRLPYWQQTLGNEAPETAAFVAETPDNILGVISFGPSDHPAMHGAQEIKHLYVDDKARKLGLGRDLLNRALAHFKALGIDHASLAVVQENTAARRFYAAMGGVEIGHFTDPGPLWRSSNIVVSWQIGSRSDTDLIPSQT